MAPIPDTCQDRANEWQEQMKVDMEAMKGQMTIMMATMMSMNKVMKEFCEDFKIQHHDSTPYWPKMNDAIEVVN